MHTHSSKFMYNIYIFYFLYLYKFINLWKAQLFIFFPLFPNNTRIFPCYLRIQIFLPKFLPHNVHNSNHQFISSIE